MISFIQRLSSRFSALSGILLFGLFLFNMYLAYRCSKVVNLRTVTVTNVVELVSFPSNAVPSSPSSPPSFIPSLSPSSPSLDSSASPVHEPPHEVARWSYRYFTVSRRVGVESFGRYYYEGSPCSVGRISEIYPDRIILSDGNWISNSFADRTERKMEVARNDKR